MESRWFKIKTFCFLLGAIINPVSAQEISTTAQDFKVMGEIKGRIQDYETQKPLEGVTISIKGSGWKAQSGADGRYAFSDIPVGYYILTFNLQDYYPDTRTDVIVRSNRATFLNMKLFQVRMIQEEVNVTSTYFSKTPEKSSSQMQVNAEELRRDAGSAGDVSRALYFVPGVIKADEEANDLIVRGGSPTENGFYLDNIFMPNINHFPQMGASGGNISMLNMDFIESVQIFTGGFDASYGNRLSSILDIGYREGNRERINSQINFSTIGYGAQIEGPLPNNKGSWMISGNQSFLDLIRALISDSDNKSSFYDVQGKMVYDLNDSNRLSFLMVGGHSQTLYDPGSEKFNQFTAGLNWRHLWGSVGYSDTSFSYSKLTGKENYYNSFLDELIGNYDYTNQWITIRNVNQLQISPSHKFKFGFEAQNYRSRSWNYYEDIGEDKEYQGTFSSAFVTYVVYPFHNVSLSSGLRYDYYPFSKRSHWSPRFTANWMLTERFSVNASYGIFYQQIPIFLIKQHPDNLKLKDSRARHLVLGFKYLINESTQITLEGYDKQYDDFPMTPVYPYYFVIDEVSGDQDEYYYRGQLVDDGKAYARGIELTLQKKLSKNLYGLVNLTYYRARYRDLFGIWRNRMFDNRFILCISGGYKPNKYWEFNIRWIWSGNKAFSPVNEANSKLYQMYWVDRKDIMAGYLNDYKSLSIRVDKRFYFNKTNLVLYAGALNVTNHQNELYRYWMVGPDEYDSEYMWGIIPYIGLEFEF
ncbi:carboxypeptidase regulatory-like domain-containing protein [Acidobacteriota bacterium]